MAYRQIILGKDTQITKLEKTLYTNVAAVFIVPLPNEAKMNSSLVDGYVKIFNGSTQIAEVNDTDIDLVASIGKFCVGSDNVIKLIVAKDKYADADVARADLTGWTISYDVQPLSFIDNKYVVEAYDFGSGVRLYPSKILSFEDIQSLISTYCRDLDLEFANEPIFRIRPAIQVKTS